MKEIIWREKRIPVKNEKIRVLILSFEETLVELDRADNYDKKMSLFDKLFVSYNDAIRAIKDEIGLLAVSIFLVGGISRVFFWKDIIFYWKLWLFFCGTFERPPTEIFV